MPQHSDFHPEFLLATFSKSVDGRQFVDMRLLDTLQGNTNEMKKRTITRVLSEMLPGTALDPQDCYKTIGKHIFVEVTNPILF
jgi:hypothetical protein